MKEKLQALEQFFYYNLQIKQMISLYPEIYTEEDAIKYVDKMNKNLQDIKYMLTKMLQTLGNDETLIEHLNTLFNYYEKTLLNCNYDSQKLLSFYQTCISNMDPELIKKTNQEIKGYYLFSNYHNLFLQSKTVNELLHILHMHVVNTEHFYESMPIIAQKEDENVGTITLYGNDNPLARAIFESIDFNINSSNIDILSLNNNKILIMARDLGHALTIEIEIEDTKAHVSYFIPKVCNIDMINNLKGITPIKINDNSDLTNLYARGSFEVNKQDLIPELYELMIHIPQDKDMFTEGGILSKR